MGKRRSSLRWILIPTAVGAFIGFFRVVWEPHLWPNYQVTEIGAGMGGSIGFCVGLVLRVGMAIVRDIRGTV